MKRRETWVPLRIVADSTYVLTVDRPLTAPEAALIKKRWSDQTEARLIILANGISLARERRRWWSRASH